MVSVADSVNKNAHTDSVDYICFWTAAIILCNNRYRLAPTSPCHVSLTVIYLDKFIVVFDF